MAVVIPPFSASPGTYLTPSGGGNFMVGGQSYAPTAAPTPDFGSQLATGLLTIAPVMAIMGAVNSAVGAYYQAESQKNAMQMQAQNLRFAAQMGRINERAARAAVVEIGREGQQRIGRYTMGAGQARAGARAALAGRGATLGQGTAAEIIGSMDVTKEIDRLSMSAATVRAQEAAKLQAFNVGTQALMSDISAQNLQATSQTISPGLSLGTSLLTSASDIGLAWARNRRIEELLGGVSTRRM